MNQYTNQNRGVFKICLILFACFAYSSCKKFVQVPLPPNEIVSAAVFSDSADATSAVLGIYTACMNSYQLTIGNGGLSLFTGFSSDELVPTSISNSGNYQFYTNSILSNNVYNEDYLWFLAYQMIYQTNACIEGIENNQSLSNTLRGQLLGESKMVRAFFYFNLVNLYGEVPLVTSTNYSVNSVMGRSNIDTVYAQITNDLLSAESLLPINSSLGVLRPGYLSTEALLAKVYLFEGQWSNAINTASKVISSGDFSLQNNLSGVFLEGSSEAIWQLSPVVAGRATVEGGVYVPSMSTVIPGYIINRNLLNAFEQGDLRRSEWLDSNVVSGKAYYYPYKYRLVSNSGQSPQEAYTILRLSEQYLIRAEAEVQANDVNDALTDLNTIRIRAGLLPYAGATDQSSLLNAIYHERQVELFCECGNRWFDLKRTNMIDEVMGGSTGVCASKGGSWVSTAALYPIPLSQLLANSSLVQNSGY